MVFKSLHLGYPLLSRDSFQSYSVCFIGVHAFKLEKALPSCFSWQEQSIHIGSCLTSLTVWHNALWIIYSLHVYRFLALNNRIIKGHLLQWTIFYQNVWVLVKDKQLIHGIGVLRTENRTLHGCRSYYWEWMMNNLLKIISHQNVCWTLRKGC